MAASGVPEGGRACRAPAPSDADQALLEKSGHFGQDGPGRRRTDRPVHDVPPGGQPPSDERKAARSHDTDNLSNELLELTRQITQVEGKIRRLFPTAILPSLPRIGPVVCAMLTAKTPELSRSPESRPLLSQDSGQMCGKRMVELRQVLYQAALIASIHYNDLNFFGNRIDLPLAPVQRRNLLAQVALTKPEDMLCEEFIIGNPFGAP